MGTWSQILTPGFRHDCSETSWALKSFKDRDLTPSCSAEAGLSLAVNAC